MINLRNKILKNQQQISETKTSSGIKAKIQNNAKLQISSQKEYEISH